MQINPSTLFNVVAKLTPPRYHIHILLPYIEDRRYGIYNRI